MTKDEGVSGAIRALSSVGNYIVDLGAIAGIAFVAIHNVPEATMQVITTAIVSIAIGKRYLE